MRRMACPSCGAARGHLLGCEHSPVQFAPAPAVSPPPALGEGAELDTTRARALAVPIALAVAALLSTTSFGGLALRLFFGMWLHELGHAFASWACGVFAVPLPWITFSGEGRSPVMVALLIAGLAALAWWLRERAHPARLVLPAALGALGLVGLLLPLRHVRTFIVFFGDGGAMVFGALLMLGAVLLPDGARLSRGALRWGYLVIGAGAFVDAFATWVRSARDFAELPFGRSESSGLSDALKLVESSGWSEQFMVRAYLGVGFACLAVLALAVGRQLVTSSRR